MYVNTTLLFLKKIDTNFFRKLKEISVTFKSNKRKSCNGCQKPKVTRQSIKHEQKNKQKTEPNKLSFLLQLLQSGYDPPTQQGMLE